MHVHRDIVMGLGCSAGVECGDHKEKVRENGEQHNFVCFGVGFGMNEIREKKKIKIETW